MTKQLAATIFLTISSLLLPACNRDDIVTSGSDSTPPLPPIDLTVFYARDGGVFLLWNANRNADLAGFRIYRKVELQPGSFQMVEETTETAFLDGGLGYSTTYLYAVTAFDEAGNESVFSNVVSAQPMNVSAPDPPRNFRVQAHNRDDGVSISMTWDANTEGDLRGYYVYRSVDPLFVAGVQSLFDSTFTPTFNDTVGVEVGLLMHYRIAAFDRGHFIGNPTDVEGDKPLDRPMLDSPADGVTTSRLPTFRWRLVPDASEYRIFVSTARFSGEIWSFMLADTAVVYGGPSLSPSVTYYWKVGTISNTSWDPNSLSAVWSFRPG